MRTVSVNEAGVREEDARVWVESGQVAGRAARTCEAEPLVERRVLRLALKREARHAELTRQLDQRAHHTVVSEEKARSALELPQYEYTIHYETQYELHKTKNPEEEERAKAR